MYNHTLKILGQSYRDDENERDSDTVDISLVRNFLSIYFTTFSYGSTV